MISFQQASELINSEIEKIKFTKNPVELYEPIDYILSLGGKRVRPAFVLMAFNLYSSEYLKALKPAIGLEIFHNFTLIHDDIMDNSPIRRNKATVHQKWNNNIAILSGDTMMIKAYEWITACEDKYLRKIVDLFNKTAPEVCEGQQMDMNFEKENFVSETDYIQMIELKTAVLIAASFQMGAILGGANTTESDCIYELGRNIGLAFQLQDDLLDVYGNKAVFGKRIGGDIISNKKTFLLIKAFELANGKNKIELQNQIKAIHFDPELKVQTVKRIYDELSIKQLTEQKIESFFEKSFSFLQKLNIKQPDKNLLYQTFQQLYNRDK